MKSSQDDKVNVQTPAKGSVIKDREDGSVR